MHVRDQIVRAVVSRLRATISEGSFLAFEHASVDWDGRTYPYAIVSGGRSRIDIEPGTGGRVQRREFEIVVEVHDLETEGHDYTARLGEIAIAVEACVADLEDDLPIDTVEALSDTGIVDINEDSLGIHVGVAITFGVAAYTHTGDAGKIIVP